MTLAFALRRNFPWRRVPGYLVAQLIGGVLAASLLRILFGLGGWLGATAPGAGFSVGTALIMEILLTTGLVSVVLGTASGARDVGSNGALALAATLPLPVCGRHR